MNHKESNTKIYFSSNYSDFKFLPGNRDLNEKKVEKIKHQVQKGVDILKYAPIIVNEKMEIIDGQHRFAVARELKTNVYYVIHLDADLKIIPSINSNSSKWRNVDFLCSYIDLGKGEYSKLAEFTDTYPVNLPTAIKFLHSGDADGRGSIEDFQDGNFKANYLEDAVETCELLKDFKGSIKNAFSGRMICAMTILKNNGKYDHKLMVKKFAESGRKIEDIRSVKTIIEEMESIVNHKSKSRIFIH